MRLKITTDDQHIIAEIDFLLGGRSSDLATTIAMALFVDTVLDRTPDRNPQTMDSTIDELATMLKRVCRADLPQEVVPPSLTLQ